MRLLNTHTGKLSSFNRENVPNYAILSHVWDTREQTFQDVQKIGRKLHTHARSLFHFLPPGLSAKLRGACEFAAAKGYDWIWVDTCCIDKESSAELSEAINSMYKWYSKAGICIAYLADVDDLDGDTPDLEKTKSALVLSRWFTRGWTLQELIAPKELVFVSKGWKPFGNKVDLAEALEAITGVNKEVLTQARSLSTISIAERMSWAAERETTRDEDRAYSLLGIFGVYMSPLYGEGTHAFRRLQEVLLRSSPDQTLFAWEFPPDAQRLESPASDQHRPPGLFADSPCRFAKRGLKGLAALTIEEIPMAAKAFRSALGLLSASPQNENDMPDELPSLLYDTPACSLTNYGIRARMPVVSRPDSEDQSRYAVAILAAVHESGYVGLVLQRLLQVETTHYAAGMHATRLIHVDTEPNHGDPSSRVWAEQLDLAHNDVAIRWKDLYITTTDPWNAQIRPAVGDIPLELLSGIPASDLNYFHSGRHHSFATRRCLATLNSQFCRDQNVVLDPSIGDTDLDKRQMSTEVQYACKLWLRHLPLSSPDYGLLKELSTFVNKHLLHWVEALSSMKELGVALDGLPAAFDWLFKNASTEEALLALLSDVAKLIRVHRDMLITSTLQFCRRTLFFKLPECELSRQLLAASGSKITLLSPRFTWTTLLKDKRDGDASVGPIPIIYIDSGSNSSDYTELVGHKNSVSAVDFAPDGETFATSSLDKTVCLWKTSKAKRLRTLPHDHPVRAVRFSPDGTVLATASDNSTFRLFETLSWQVIWSPRLQFGEVGSLAFSMDGSCVACGSNNSVAALDIVGRANINVFSVEHRVNALAFSPDRTQIVTSLAVNNASTRVWETATGQCLAKLPGPSGRIHSLEFSSGGGRVVSRGYNGRFLASNIPSPTSLQNPPSADASVDEAPIRFSWQLDSAGESGWLHFIAGSNEATSKPVCWLPKERWPCSDGTCYAWHGDIVVIGSENGMVTVLDLSEAVRSL